ncbi:MAG: hypothetical protein NKF37_03480 [Tropheryma whipplei]|nr:hypothetical protein [Tropheryma whipplei]
MPKTTTSVTQPRQSSFFPLLTGFFTYLFLLTRPHKRRLFMAGLVRKYNNPPWGVHFVSYVLTAIPVILFIMSLTYLFSLLGVDRGYYMTSASSGGSLFFLIFVLFFYQLVVFPYLDRTKRSFFLRYSYYSQTPSFQNPTKRRQILLLDTVTRYGTRWTKGDLLMLALLPVMFFLLWLNSTFLPGFSTVFYTQSTVFLLLVILIYCLWLFGYNSPPIRKLLYNLHIRRHGPIPKELTDIVTQAYEIYPQVTT